MVRGAGAVNILCGVINRASHGNGRAPRRALAAAALALLALLLALPATAGSAVRLKLGFMVPEQIGADEVQRLNQSGVHTLRAQLGWTQVQRCVGNRLARDLDWDNDRGENVTPDDLATAVARNRMDRIAMLSGTPQCAAQKRRSSFPPRPAFMDDYLDFVRAAVNRYGPRGYFWRKNPQLPYHPVEFWEVGNEPNTRTNWPDPDPGEYARFLRQVSGTIHDADRTATVLLGGITSLNGNQNGRDFIRRIYGALGNDRFRRVVDVVSIHPYVDCPRCGAPQVKDNIQAVRKLMNKRDDRGPIWVTEIGWGTCCKRAPLEVSESQQAQLLRATTKMMRSSRGPLELRRALWYTSRDFDNDRDGFWDAYAGLVRYNGQLKPSWSTWLDLTGGSGRQPFPPANYPPNRG